MKPRHLNALILLAIAAACGNEPVKQEKPAAAGQTQIQLFRNGDGTWGYDILYQGKPYVHQPHIPAIGGKGGFASENQARKVAEGVAHKINSGIMPPSLAKKEVDSLIQLAE
jgi:hypothetical protein